MEEGKGVEGDNEEGWKGGEEEKEEEEEEEG